MQIQVPALARDADASMSEGSLFESAVWCSRAQKAIPKTVISMPIVLREPPFWQIISTVPQHVRHSLKWMTAYILLTCINETTRSEAKAKSVEN